MKRRKVFPCFRETPIISLDLFCRRLTAKFGGPSGGGWWSFRIFFLLIFNIIEALDRPSELLLEEKSWVACNFFTMNPKSLRLQLGGGYFLRSIFIGRDSAGWLLAKLVELFM